MWWGPVSSDSWWQGSFSTDKLSQSFSVLVLLSDMHKRCVFLERTSLKIEEKIGGSFSAFENKAFLLMGE